MSLSAVITTPKLYRDRTPGNFSKFQVMQKIFKGLVAVGMKPIMAPAWTEVPIDEAPDKQLFPHLYSNVCDCHLDFPTGTPSYTINGEEWIPIVSILTGNYQDDGARVFNYGVVDFRLRRIGDPTTLDPGTDTLPYSEYEGMDPNLKGWGGSTAETTSSYYSDRSGTLSGDQYHKLVQADNYTSGMSGQNPTLLLSVRNVEVLLCKGGLHIMVGSGYRKGDAGDIINASLLFMEDRVPGRRLPPADDLALQKTVPLVLASWIGEDPRFASSGANGRFRGRGVHCAYIDALNGLTEKTMRLRMELFPRENLEYVELQDDPRVWDSPRAIGDTSYHVLSPLVGYFYYREGTGETLCNTQPAWNVGTPLPKWEELFVDNYCAVTDPSAPYGVFTDPNTGKKWFLFLAPTANTVVGFEVEGLEIITTYVSPHTLVSETHLNMATGSFVADDGTPIEREALGTGWVIDGPSDTISRTATTAEAHVELDIDVTGDPADTEYEIVYEARFRGDAGTAWPLDTSSSQEISTLVFPQYKHLGRNTNDYSANWRDGGLRCVGDVTTLEGYDWVERRSFVRLDVDGKIRFKLFWDYLALSGSKTFEARNFRLRRFNRY